MSTSIELEGHREHLRKTLRSVHKQPHFANSRTAAQRVELDKSLKEFVFRYLYYMLTDNGKHLNIIFGASNETKFPKSVEDILDIGANAHSLNEPFYKYDKRSANRFRHCGRSCGRKFKSGEPIYRCHECGDDDTCVLCIHCFNPEDHVNHHVFTDICSDFSTGICDCGDEEAWKNTLHCKTEVLSDDIDDLKQKYIDNNLPDVFAIVLAEVFDHFIDVFNQNIEPLPSLQKEITHKLRDATQQGKINERSEFLEDLAYSNEYCTHTDGLDRCISGYEQDGDQRPAQEETTEELEDSSYTVMIYNDEFHNYAQATTAIRQGVPDNMHTDLLTSVIDGEGRAMLKCSKSLSAVIGGFFAVQTNGLSATLTKWSEYIHQETCKYMIMWLLHCLAIPDDIFQSFFRDALGEVLCDECSVITDKKDMRPVIEKYFHNKLDESNPYVYADLCILNGNRIPLGRHKYLDESDCTNIALTLNETKFFKNKEYRNSRLQYLLFFDNRYWKRLRKDLQNVIIPTLSSHKRFKPIFCQHLTEIFSHIFRSLTYVDREPQLTALRESVVQLFTCPTNAAMIFETKSFIDIIWTIIDVLSEFCKLDNGQYIWQRVQKSNPTKSFSISIKQGLYIIETLLSKNQHPNSLLQTPEFISIMSLCKLFNGAWKLKRKEGEHVLHEDQNFIPYLEHTTTIYSIIQTVELSLDNDTLHVEESKVLNAIKLLISFLAHRNLSYKQVAGSNDIIKFNVSKEKVAFMNPVHTFFSFLTGKVPLRLAYGLKDNELDFLTVSDFPLRSIVLCAQIDVGFWVRNGVSVLHQAAYYKKNPELNSYASDIHLNQLSVIWEHHDMPRILYNILDRWELLNWFNGDEEFNKTVYEDKITMMIQQFLTFLYQLLTERDAFRKDKQPEEQRKSQIQDSIIYSLYMKPLTYSKLLKQVPAYLTHNSTEFDEALREVSVFVEPKGLTDNGVFKLKEKLYTKVDPLKHLNKKNEFESSANVIKTHLSKGKAPEKVVLKPQIIQPELLDEMAPNLGAFAYHPIFVKLLYKLLQVSLDNEDGAFMGELLHLLHAVFVDYEQTYGPDKIHEAYLEKPICSLLLSVVNSKNNVFSDGVINVADYILESMIKKRPEEVLQSMIASFGDECVKQYKTRKLTEGIKLEESETDRKRRNIKRHQQKMMAKFNDQQSRFEFEHRTELDDGDVDMEGVNNKSADYFTCSLCQDDANDDFFVIPAHHEQSPVFRSATIADMIARPSQWRGFYNDDEKIDSISDDMLKEIQSDGTHGSRKVFISCNHQVHHNCFKRYIQKKRFGPSGFICPLCQTFSNCVLPIKRTNKTDSTLTLNALLNEESGIDTMTRLFQNFSSSDYKNIYSIFGHLLSTVHSFDKKIRKMPDFREENTALILSAHWANTISMLEIASRLDDDTISSFLIGRDQKYLTLKNVLNCIMLLWFVIGKPDPNFTIYTTEDDGGSNPNQLFRYIVNDALFSKRPLKSTINEALILFTRQFFEEFFSGSQSIDESNYAQLHDGDMVLDEKVYEYLRLMDSNRHSTCFSEKCKQYYDFALRIYLTNIAVTLRRCWIMIKVFHELVDDFLPDTLLIDGTNIMENFEGATISEFVGISIPLITNFASLNDLIITAVNYEHDDEFESPYLKNIPYEFTGIVKLTNLSQYLNKYLINSKEIGLRVDKTPHVKNAENRLDFKVCLTCGMKIHSRSDRNEMSIHLLKNCFKSFGVFLIPNTSEVCLYLTQPTSHLLISAPYLNSHGEVGRNAMRRGDMTALNLGRYKHLNKLWINNEIPGYISRVMGDEFRLNILSNGFLFTFNHDPRPRRVPPGGVGTGAASDSDSDAGENNLNFDTEDINGDILTMNAEGGRVPLFGTGEGPAQVMNFFEIFENLRNAVTNGIDPGEQDGADIRVPFVQLVTPQMRDVRAPEDEDEDSDEGFFPTNNDVDMDDVPEW